MPYNQLYEKNENCIRCNNKVARKKVTKDTMCHLVFSTQDQMPMRCVGGWAREKITRLEKYFDILCTGMYKKWENINYIEICSGPGICIDRDSQIEFNGTALAILFNKAYKYVSKCVFIDYSTEVVDVLNGRIRNLEKDKAIAFAGDYYNSHGIVSLIQENTNQNKALNLVFIDPTDCSVPFDTIVQIKKNLKNVDFIINIATMTDFNRNVKNIINDPIQYSKLKNKYEMFLNNNSFFDENIGNLVRQNSMLEIRNIFRNAFTSELKKIGIEHFSFKEVEDYYDILFASAHPKGLEFWELANRIEPNGQRSLFG